MAVNILVVITYRKLPELSCEAFAAGVVDTTYAPTFASPVTEGLDVLIKSVVVGLNGATLTHGHVVWWIEGTCADIADGAGLFPFTINEIFRTQGVAVVFY